MRRYGVVADRNERAFSHIARIIQPNQERLMDDFQNQVSTFQRIAREILKRTALDFVCCADFFLI